MKRTTIILTFTLGALSGSYAQDPVFSQFYTSSLYLNPALAGMEEDVVLAMNYRTQWSGVDLPFRTFQFSAIHPIVQRGIRNKQLGGFGATLFSDEAGRNREIVSQGFSIASSYNFHLNRSGNHIVATALQFGVIQRQINADALQWSSQYSSAIGYDPSLPGEQLISERVTSPAIHAGVMWRFASNDALRPLTMFYNGFAISNINKPRGFYVDEKDGSRMLYKLHGGYLHSLPNGIEISPNYLIQHQRTTQINLGAYAAYPLPRVTSRTIDNLKISAGLWYRVGDSFIVTTGASTTRWTAGFSYDANSSSLERNFEGANAFEISFAYRIKMFKATSRFSTPLI